jgi:hypothetical protein
MVTSVMANSVMANSVMANSVMANRDSIGRLPFRPRWPQIIRLNAERGCEALDRPLLGATSAVRQIRDRRLTDPGQLGQSRLSNVFGFHQLTAGRVSRADLRTDAPALPERCGCIPQRRLRSTLVDGCELDWRQKSL